MAHPKPTFLDEVMYAAARVAPGKWRAFLDLFVGRFAQKVDWGSGLGDSVYTLYALVRTLRPENIIEIGSAKGRSTCAMALACAQNKRGKVYAIDPHTENYWSDSGAARSSYNFLLERLRSYGLTAWCEVIRKTSKEALTHPPISTADFVFIDGDHSYEGVKLDFELCQPLLTEHAVVAVHDSGWGHLKDDPHYRPGLGVLRYLQELREQGFEAVTLAAWPGLTLLQGKRGGFDYRADEQVA